MKKFAQKLSVLLAVGVIAAALLSSCYYDDSASYPRGKDTAVYVGDGRFQIAVFDRSIKDKNGLEHNVEQYGVVDGKTNEEIEPDVQKYYDDSGNSVLYLIGGNGYTVIHYDTGEWLQEESLDDIIGRLPSDEAEILRNGDGFKSP